MLPSNFKYLHALNVNKKTLIFLQRNAVETWLKSSRRVTVIEVSKII
jgi:hypothetical protein